MPRVPVRPLVRSTTSRTEAFSDGVFAIAVTILVLDLATPAHPPGGLGRALGHLWPAYLGYVASFSYIAVIWLNHHQIFMGIRTMDRGLHAANFFLLMTTSALAFPTAVVSEALGEDLTGKDARVAVALYAGISAAMCLSWTSLYVHLGRHPELLDDSVESAYVRSGVSRSWVGMVLYVAAGVLGALVTPLIALAVFVLLPAFYFLSSSSVVAEEEEAA
ncbi:TMEM175 family protein [Actinacidiphila acidipaludis]|uniref:DUF1211 domain-containing protein n=1 Tax=Actinacidiphila acidipaludis TaxID=2873382 RepID=A0ABS7PZ24_9ACTN|nr:TMEM175 family protein [Streptomyces acidipaludis]MBY8876142.1 DUF1211 domain-containing protein [Streptomyces acidipaludis]